MVSTGVKAALDTVLARKATQYDLQSFFMMYDTFEAEVKELKSSFEFEESRLKQLEAEQKQLGFFSFSKKKESAQSIDVQLDKLKDKKKELADAEMKLKELKSLFPEARSIKEDIIRYDSRLKAIESLYLA